MIFQKIEVQSFGKLKGFELEPKSGLNLYCYPNEFGKSTLIAFLYFIFYGYESKWMKDYFPWDGGPLSGSLTFTLEGKTWQIFRHHPVKGAEKQQVICKDNGEELVLASKEKPGSKLLKLDGETFLKTFCVRQGELTFGRTDGLDTALKNLAATGDENASFQQAMDFLHKEHSRYLYRGRMQGPLADLKNTILSHKDDLYRLEREIEEQIEEKERMDALEQERRENEEERQRLEQELEQAKRNDAARRYRQWKALCEGKEERATRSAAEDSLLLEQEQCHLLAEQKEQAEKSAEEARSFAQRTLQGENERMQSLYLPPETEGRLARFGKGNPAAAAAGVLCLLLAAASGVMGIMISPLLWIACPLFAVIGILAFFYGKLAERQFCRNCGVVSRAQLEQRWQQYQQALERVKELQDRQEAREQEYRQAKEQREQVQARLQILIAKTRLMNLQEVREERITRAVRSQTAEGLKAQILALLEGQTPEELAKSAEGGNPEGEGYQVVFDRLQESNLRRDRLFAALSSKDLHQLSALWKEAGALEQTIREEESRAAQWGENLSAVRRSLEWLEQANEDMNRHFAPRLCALAGEFLSLLTDGKYTDVRMDDRYEIRLSTPEGSFPVSTFSQGTKDAVYFAFRLGVGALLGEVQIPLLLDDPFVNLDPKRQKQAEIMLEKAAHERQILYFTCRG